MNNFSTKIWQTILNTLNTTPPGQSITYAELSKKTQIQTATITRYVNILNMIETNCENRSYEVHPESQTILIKARTGCKPVLKAF